MRKTKLTPICNTCGKINSPACAHCKVIKKLLPPKEKKHDIWHHDDREWEVTAEIELAKKARQEEAAKKAASATAEDNDTGIQFVEDEEENTSTTELAKAIGNHVSVDEVKRAFKDKHLFRNHEGRLWRLFGKFIDCWSITKISKTSNDLKQNLQKKFQRRIKMFLEANNIKITDKKKMITPDKFKKNLYL